MTLNEDRIVITGMGTVSAYGVDDNALWSAIKDGVIPQARLNPKEVPKVVRVNQFHAADFLGKKGLLFMKPCSLFLSVASEMALKNAFKDKSVIDPDRLGIFVSTNYSGFKMSAEFDKTTITKGPRFVSPMETPNTVDNSPASYLAIRIQSRAFNATIASGFCAGLDALGYAISMLRQKNADIVVVGGTEEWNDEVNWYYKHAGLLPKEYEENSGRAFHPESNGIMPGEGSAAVVLERYEDAIKRKATILGELVIWNACFAPVEDEEKRVQGFIRCINTTIHADAARDENIDLIISGANGLPCHDRIESTAFMTKFPNKPILAIKNTIGETSGAAGLFQLVASLHAIRNKTNFCNKTNKQWEGIETVLLTAIDLFGGMSSVLVRKVNVS